MPTIARWLENVPLYAGTNALTVTVTNAAGFGATTNLTLYQSGVTLAMDTMDTSLLNQVYVNVTGTISTNSYIVWVNGVLGTNNGDGTWSATNVPVTAGGTGSFDVAAYPSGSAPTNSAWTNFAVELLSYPNAPATNAVQAHADWDKPAVVYIEVRTNYFFSSDTTSGGTAETYTLNQPWTRGGGGYLNSRATTTNSGATFWEISGETNTFPPDAGDVPVLPGPPDEYYDNSDGSGTTALAPTPPDQAYIENAAVSGVIYSADFLGGQSWFEVAGQVEKLFTGGKASRQSQSLFVLNQALSIETNGGFLDAVASAKIALGPYGNEDPYGNAWLAAGGGQHLVITPTAPYPWTGGSLASVGQFDLVHHTEVAASGDTNLNRKTIGVGEYVDLSGMPPDTQWTTTAGSLLLTNGATNLFTAPSNAMFVVTVTAITNGVPVPVDFKVLAPSGNYNAVNLLKYYYGTNADGAGMDNAVYMRPTNVSFWRVQIQESPAPATTETGYFTITNYFTPYNLQHGYLQGAGDWIPLDYNNCWTDTFKGGPFPNSPIPWTNGTVSWNVLTLWAIDTNHPNLLGSGWTQIFSNYPSGTLSASKFGITVTRDTNNVYH